MTSGSSGVKLNALKKIGAFDGTGDIERWIDRLELALEIDEVPTASHARVLSYHLEGDACDTWKGLSWKEKEDADAIKAELRSVFGLQKMAAWTQATAPVVLAPGESVDVAFQDLKRLVTTASTGTDTVSQVAACLLVQRLPTSIREQVLLTCGKTMDPSQVLSSAKQLMAASSDNCLTTSRYSATALVNHGHFSSKDGQAELQRRKASQLRRTRCGGCERFGHLQAQCRVRCFRCSEVGHVARKCSARSQATSASVPAVPGNGVTGQSQE